MRHFNNKTTIPFVKMAGAGNDFIVIESSPGLNYKELALRICHRTSGVGADGLLILGKTSRAEYQMRIINSDGSEAEMCGNGARCMAAYIAARKSPLKAPFSIKTLAGTILGQAKGETALVRLSAPRHYQTDLKLTIKGRRLHVHSIDTGVPHVIVFVYPLRAINVREIGRLIRFHSLFKPRGTNVNFVEQLNDQLVAVRTYERGVEDETRACGTGSVAAALVTFLQNNPGIKNSREEKMMVKTASNETLSVTFKITNSKISDVWLEGSASFIAEGKFLNKL